MKKNQSKKGFTLVEIMIVVVIIALLAAMAVPAFQRVRDTSRENAALNDLRQLASAADQYFLENGVTTVNRTALVGVSSYVKSLRTDNTYPTTITQGTNIEATVPSVGTVSYGF